MKIHSMAFYGYHGVSPAEKELAGRFSVDVEFPHDVAKAAHTDNLADTVDYEAIYRLVENVVTGNKFHLVETLCERIAHAIADEFAIEILTVRVRKNNPPFPGHLEYVEIETTIDKSAEAATKPTYLGITSKSTKTAGDSINPVGAENPAAKPTNSKIYSKSPKTPAPSGSEGQGTI